MIFYFSGTGNSEIIAQMVAEAIGDCAVNMVGSSPDLWNDEPGKVLGIVFPIYAYTAPEYVLEFAKQLKKQSAFTIGICTYSNVAGDAMEHFSQAIPLDAAYGIRMPDNYPVLDHIIDTKESTIEKLQKAKLRFDSILPSILALEKCWDVEKGENSWENTYIRAPMFNQVMRKTAPFYADELLCLSCGLCEELCPAKAIVLSNGIPAWVKEDCFMCMACINRCPSAAIEFGPYSPGRFRYYFKGFEAEKYQ